ncbi:unnamed protein product [Microthlaspi erraticum]|uniref:F-box domain-containing protein n=1 Tax=Microthlaspi erraticum TaxID=1685480 RepID=A0A6D2LM03_9BRAS|nr:unnamed protein product [Microthlaspi erraticum]CAA7061045.1 unnamed protein product [Microthlaspi erraticum]
MDKADDSSRQVSKWANLHRDILVIIFYKLDVRDLTMGASRVCITWFLASHDKTLWNTVDLAKFRQVDGESLSLRNFLNKIIKFFDIHETRRNLTNITKLSRSTPKNLFFDYDAYIEEEDLMFAAERMPNIEKLVLPRWSFQTKNSYQFAFSQWKNLETLIIANDSSLTGKLGFQEVGENCSNLINLKYMGDFEKNTAENIVRYLKNIKRLSLRCSSISHLGVLLLIRGLKNLAILNLSHCRESEWDHIRNLEMVTIGNLEQAATQKQVIFLGCSLNLNNCRVCKERPYCRFWPYGIKNWRNDEIKEFEF